MTPEDEIRAKLHSIAGQIKAQLPKGFCFILLVAQKGEGGTLLYVADVNRADALQVMREFIAVNIEERNWQREMPELEIEEEFAKWWDAQLQRPQKDLKTECRDAFIAGRMTQ